MRQILWGKKVIEKKALEVVGGRSLYIVKSRYDRTVTFLIRTHVSTNCKQATQAAKPF